MRYFLFLFIFLPSVCFGWGAGLVGGSTTAGGGGAPITYVNHTTNTATGTEVTVTKPTGINTGDLLIAGYSYDAIITLGATWPTDFVELTRTTTNSSTQGLAYKVATGSEPADYTISGADAGYGLVGSITVFAKSSGTWSYAADLATTGSGSANTLASTAVTCTDDDVLMIEWSSDGGDTIETGGTPPATMTNIHETVQGGTLSLIGYYEQVDSGSLSRTAVFNDTDNLTALAVCISN